MALHEVREEGGGNRHLLLGGRASIRRGAVHEAERRLESGSRFTHRPQVRGSPPVTSRTSSRTRSLEGVARPCFPPSQLSCRRQVLIALLDRRCFAPTMQRPGDVPHLSSLSQPASLIHFDPQTRLRALRLAGALAQATDRDPWRTRLLERRVRLCVLAGRMTKTWNGTRRSSTWPITHMNVSNRAKLRVSAFRVLAMRAAAHTVANARSSRY